MKLNAIDLYIEESDIVRFLNSSFEYMNRSGKLPDWVCFETDGLNAKQELHSFKIYATISLLGIRTPIVLTVLPIFEESQDERLGLKIVELKAFDQGNSLLTSLLLSFVEKFASKKLCEAGLSCYGGAIWIDLDHHLSRFGIVLSGKISMIKMTNYGLLIRIEE